MKIIFCHVLPNSLLAVVTMLGMSFGGLLGGTMIVETVFSWNGIQLERHRTGLHHSDLCQRLFPDPGIYHVDGLHLCDCKSSG